MIVYVSRRGDTLPSVARRFHLRPEELAQNNALTDPTRLAPGLALAIPGPVEARRREIVVNACAEAPLFSPSSGETLRHASFLCSLSCLMSGDGLLIPPEDGELVRAARTDGAAPLLCVANLTEDGAFSAALAHRVLADGYAQDTFFAQLLSLLETRGYRGAYLHLMYLYPFDRERLTAFLRRAAALLHERGFFLLTAAAPREIGGMGTAAGAAHDYAAHGQSADWIVLTTYDWGHAASEPQPISPLGQIRRALDRAVEQIPREKILLGVSNHACSWTLPWREGRGEASLMSSAAAANLAVAAGAAVRYDRRAAASRFRYRDDAGVLHELWYEDVRSFLSRFALVKDYGLGGLSLWTVNTPNPPLLLAQEELFAAVKLS